MPTVSDLKRDWLKIQTSTVDPSVSVDDMEMKLYFGANWSNVAANTLAVGRYNYWKAICGGAALVTDTVDDLERKAIIIAKAVPNPALLTLDDLRVIYYT